ncbi:MAG: hypothetical protein H0V72_07975 [Bradyrhizobium sp.]|nr:hypothetical protein [Bradyrhizobium sp.]
MQTPALFAITEQAKRRIESVKKEHEAKINTKVIVAIMWLDCALNNERLQSQPAIGFYDDRTEIESDISIIDGMEMVLAVSENDKVHFIGKTLDYDDSRFFIR